jgi:hypothetical protein
VRYLNHEFDSELADCDTEAGLEELLDRLNSISNSCGIGVEIYEAQIHDRIAELTRTDESEDRPVRQWEASTQPTSEAQQEAEVRRLFDGLRN